MEKTEVENACTGGEDAAQLTRNRSFKSKQLVRSQAIRESHSPPRTISPYPPSPVNEPKTSDSKPPATRENGSQAGSGGPGEVKEEKKQPVEIQISSSWDEGGSEQRQRTKRWLGNRHHSDSSRDLLSNNPRLACVCGACECHKCRGQRRKHDCPVKQDSGIACSVECPDCDYDPISPNGDEVRKSGSFEDQISYCRCPPDRNSRQDRPRNFSFTRSDSDIAEPSWVELVTFIKGTLNKNPRDRATMLKIEKDLHAFVNDAGRCVVRFPVMTSYGRMLVHRCAALFQLSHRLDSVHKGTVVVSKNGTSGGRIPCTSFRQWCTASFPRSPPPKPEDTSAKSILKRSGTSEEAGSGAAGGGARSLEQRERAYQLVRRRIFSNDTGSQDSEWPWLSSGPIKLLTPEPGRNKLIKVQSLESRGAPETTTRGAVSKSHSLDGYGAEPPQTRLLSRQGDLASSSWRLSPSSSGYKTLSLRSTDSVTPSPTGCPSPDTPAQISTTPTAEDAATVAHDAPAPAVVWAVTDMSAVPPGAVVIHPQTGRPLTHADGSIYHFDPANPPVLRDAALYLNGHQDPNGEKRRGRLEKQHSFIDNECECPAEDCNDKCCCDCPDQEVCTKCPVETNPSPQSSKPNSVPNSPAKRAEPIPESQDTTDPPPTYDNPTNQRLAYDDPTNQRPAYDNTTNQRPPYDNTTNQRPAYDSINHRHYETSNQRVEYDPNNRVYDNSTNQRVSYENPTNQRQVYENMANQKTDNSNYSPSRSRPNYNRYDNNRYGNNSRYDNNNQAQVTEIPNHRQPQNLSTNQRQASDSSTNQRADNSTNQRVEPIRPYDGRYEARPPSYDQMQKEVLAYPQGYVQYRSDEMSSPQTLYQPPEAVDMQALATKMTPVPVQDPSIRPMSIAANMMYPAMHQAYPYVNPCRLEHPVHPVQQLYQPLGAPPLVPEDPKHGQTTFRIDPSYPYATDFTAACGACGDPSAMQQQRSVNVNVGYGAVELPPPYPLHGVAPPAPPAPHYPYQEALQWQPLNPLLGAGVAGAAGGVAGHKLLMPPGDLYPLLCPAVYQPYGVLYPQVGMIPQPYPICQSVYPVVDKQPDTYQQRNTIINQRQIKRNSASGSSRTTPQTPDDKKVPYEEKSREIASREIASREIASREIASRENADTSCSSEIAVTIAQIKEQLALNSKENNNRGFRGRDEWRRRNSGGGILGSYPVNNFGGRVMGRPSNDESPINPAIYNSIRNMQAKQNYQQQQERRALEQLAQYRDRHDARFDSRRRCERLPLLRPPYVLRQMTPNTWNRRSPGMIPQVIGHPRRPHPDRNPRR